MRQERRIRGYDDDNRAAFFAITGASSAIFAEFQAHGNTGYTELPAKSVIALHQDPYGVAAGSFI